MKRHTATGGFADQPNPRRPGIGGDLLAFGSSQRPAHLNGG